jgi:hypothetical protein
MVSELIINWWVVQALDSKSHVQIRVQVQVQHCQVRVQVFRLSDQVQVQQIGLKSGLNAHSDSSHYITD